MCLDDYQLPEYTMNAGTTQNITINLLTQNQVQIDADGMTARFAICDYINRGSEPFVTKTCSIIQPVGSEVSSIYCQLISTDTITLRGKFIYQVTAIDADDTVAVLKGIMNINGNVDQATISQEETE